MAKDEIATKLSSVRALGGAPSGNSPWSPSVPPAITSSSKPTTPCRPTRTLPSRSTITWPRPRLPPYQGETRVYHYLELLRDVVGFDKLRPKRRQSADRPADRRLLRLPASAPGQDHGLWTIRKIPQIIEEFLRALGAEPVIYPYRNECCGGYVALEDPASAQRKSAKVRASAADKGADLVVTACPLCKYNLVKNGGSGLPVVYFTELLAQALDVKEDSHGD